MEVSGQLHDPAALSPGTPPPHGTGWAPGASLNGMEKGKSIYSEIQTNLY
jgi:hypothetical protein